MFLAVNDNAGPHLLKMKRRFIEGKIEIELSPKPDANKPFATRFDGNRSELRHGVGDRDIRRRQYCKSMRRSSKMQKRAWENWSH